ncbi:hypothetical protein GCM10008997_15840 [Halomonas salifodinae]
MVDVIAKLHDAISEVVSDWDMLMEVIPLYTNDLFLHSDVAEVLPRRTPYIVGIGV